MSFFFYEKFFSFLSSSSSVFISSYQLSILFLLLLICLFLFIIFTMIDKKDSPRGTPNKSKPGQSQSNISLPKIDSSPISPRPSSNVNSSSSSGVSLGVIFIHSFVHFIHPFLFGSFVNEFHMEIDCFDYFLLFLD